MMPSRLVLLLLAASAVGCRHRDPAPPPPPRPAAPTPPPAAPPPPPQASTPAALDEYSRIRAMDLDAINRLGLLKTVHFDYDSAELRDGDRTTLRHNADVLRSFDFLMLTVEGHCDERGTVEYNLALGDRRARTVYEYLSSLGVPAGRLKTVSYGKESPLCLAPAEECWSRNRRAHFEVTGKQAPR